MEMIEIAGTGLKVSRIGLGTWAIGGWMWGGAEHRELVEPGVARLHRIDADVTAGMADQMAVEVVTVALRIRGPGEYVGNNLLHASLCRPGEMTLYTASVSCGNEGSRAPLTTREKTE